MIKNGINVEITEKICYIENRKCRTGGCETWQQTKRNENRKT